MNPNSRRRAVLVSAFLTAVLATACGLSVGSQGAALSSGEGLGAASASAAGASLATGAPLIVGSAIDHTDLAAALDDAGVDLPQGASVYAVRVDGEESEAYDAGAATRPAARFRGT